MTPAETSSIHLAGRLIAFINTLAPLSIVLTALGILNTIRLARVKRRQEEAQSVRETLNAAGTSAYTLNWSLLGGMDFKVPLLQLHDAIEARLGKSPAPQVLSDLINDQSLIEPMIGKVWRDSGIIDRFRQEALDFSRLSADVGDRIPLVQEALQQVNAHLRVLLLTDSNLIFNIRNKGRYRSIPASQSGHPVDPLQLVHKMFISDSTRPNDNSFSQACEFLNTLASTTAAATDRRILRLSKPQSLRRRWQDYLSSRRQDRRDSRLRPQLLKQLEEKFPNELPLLTVSLDAVLRKTRELRRKEQVLSDNAAYILRALKVDPKHSKLAQNSQSLLETLFLAYRQAIYSMHAIVRLKTLGIPDPQVDAALAQETGNLELLKSAEARGANFLAGSDMVLQQHGHHLADVDDVLLN
jgi:hypothetical protein